MRLRRTSSGAKRRRGIILLVVLVMLTLFAIAGLTFVLYADAASTSAGLNRDAESYAAADMDPNVSFNYFLGQLVYGVADPTAANPGGGATALRGHSLAETMYGGYDSLGNLPSDVPYNGTGRLSEPGLFNGTDGNQMVNYTYFPGDGFLRDPSRPGTRANPSAGRTTYTGGQNPPYTYPDTNSMFLASINQTTGQVTMPSFHRPWLFNSGANNPNWTSAQGKYMTCIVRPADMDPSFPAVGAPNGPDPNTGCSVQNLIGGPGGKDSPWIDVGAPELYTSSGVRYKMLVAPLILDLENRVNLNVHGNVFANGGHAGNQGWTAGEVNLSRVLNVGTAPNEWQNLFLGNPPAGNPVYYGRYGPNRLPASVYGLTGTPPHAYAPADLNGVNDPGQPGAFTATQVWSLPGGPNTQPFQCFPYFPPQGYGNNLNGVEIQNAGGQTAHWMFFNPLNPGPGNRLLPLSSHAALMYGGGNAGNLDLARLCPTNFNPADATTIRRIHETTALSMDLDRSGAAPYFFDPNNANYTVNYNPNHAAGASGYTYTTVAQQFPAFSGATPPNQRAATPAVSEFDPRTWRSGLPGGLASALSRIDLNRPLATYTGPNANPAQAVIDRQQFATDIFTRLLAVTGMSGVYANIANATPQQYITLRWLAQLSANIVDYIDTDDVMTAFQWTTAPQKNDNGSGYVFGTELPKLVVNEVYLQYNNGPGDPQLVKGKLVATQPYQMNVWAELVNPLPGPDVNGNTNQATLQNGNGAIYQLVLTRPNQNLRNADNIRGDPDNPNPANGPYTTQPYAPSGQYVSGVNGSQVIQVMNNWGGAGPVLPMNANYGNGSTATAGFFVVGPPTAVQGLPAATFQSPNMTYTVPLTEPTSVVPVAPTVMLQRLANPNLPPSTTLGAGYNPYVTVDYVNLDPLKSAATGINPAINDARTYDVNGAINGAPTQPYTTFASWGRNEPYTSVCVSQAKTQWAAQQRTPPSKTGPQNSFFQQNVNATMAFSNDATQPNFVPPANYPAFDWLVHMDRPLVSPIELAGVSAFKPHELTQQFIDATGQHYGHIAPWTDQQGGSLLYRLLEFVKVGSTTPGVLSGGRVPGRININTIDPNAKEVFEALCDAEPGNQFYDTSVNPTGDTQVDQVFQILMNQRTPGGVFGANNQPFWSAAQGLSSPPAGGDPMGTTQRGINQTLLAAAVKWQPGTNPYQQLEMLNKIYNNTTTRSNVFAVWLTVGFFQVMDDTTTPMKLGPEINFSQGKNIRHQMFAIIDRTQLTTFNTSVQAGGVPAGNGVAINVPTTVPDPRTGQMWQIQPGTTLVYDPGAYHINANTALPTPDPAQSNEETVIVQPGGTANFLYPHPAGTPVISRGNPGPWAKYDPAQDGQVVPYVHILN